MENLFPGPSDCNLYRRFIKVPRHISKCLGILTFINLFGYSEIALINANLNPFIGAFLSALIGLLSMVVAIELAVLAKHVMMRKRMWLWGRTHFNSWDELWDFWHDTHSDELERIAGLKDDEW